MTGATLAAALLLAAGPAPRPAPAPAGAPDPDGVELLVCRAAREQQAIERRWRELEYRKDDLKEKVEEDRVVSRELVTRWVHRTRPSGIAVNEVTGRDGRPLQGKERDEERRKTDERFRQLAEDPRELARSLDKAISDSDDKASTMAAMVRAFHLRLEGLDWLDGEPCWVVSFFPRDGFQAETKEQEAFGRMQGIAWVRATGDPVFLRVEADFIENVSVKWGPFASITKGSHLLLQQAEALPGIVMARDVDLDLKLRIFFIARRHERRGTYYRDFVRANPPRPTPIP